MQATSSSLLSNHRTALVLGASGGIGGELSRQLRSAGWEVRALGRQASAPAGLPDLQWFRGDAMNPGDVSAAAQGCQVIVHAVNPPGYQRWNELVLPMLDNTLKAARQQRATVVLPGTVYNYGPDALPEPAEDAPQRPLTRKGAIRVELEQRLLQAADAGEIQALVLRCGDFFGPSAANSWFSQGLVRPGRPVTRMQQPGRAGAGHAWAYLPDVAQTLVRLLEIRASLGRVARFHFEGHWDADGQQMLASIGRAVQAHGGRPPSVSAFPWWAVGLAAPFVPLCRELREMRYLWRQPLRLTSARLAAALAPAGGVPHTPLDQAVVATLKGLRCL